MPDHLFDDLEFSDDSELRDELIDQFLREAAAAPLDVRDALRGFSADADEFQRQVVESSATTVRVVAPAGSGKTQTVINRALFSISRGVSPRRIVILTFDNSAVRSLRTKLGEESRRRRVEVSQLPISTLNSFGYRVLRESYPREYRPIAPEHRRGMFVREVLTALKERSPDRYALLPQNVKRRVYLELIGILKNALFDPREAPTQRLGEYLLTSRLGREFLPSSEPLAVRKALQALIWIYQAFERVQAGQQLMDFDDQKLRAFMCLSNDDNGLTALRSGIDEVIVDEFQDINQLDFELVKLVAHGRRLVVTGDDDQAIYGFRGCSAEYMIDLDEYLGRAATSFELSRNYRNPPNIVEHADRLIRHNRRRIEKRPHAVQQNPARIKVVNTLSAGIEARWLAKTIQRIRAGNAALAYDDFAVLYRTNAQSLPLQVELLLADIPYHVREQDDILNNDALERLLGTLRFKIAIETGAQPRPSDVAYAVASYFRYVRPQDLRRVESIARGEDWLTLLDSEAFFRILPFARTSNLVMRLDEVIAARNLLDTLRILSQKFNGLKGMVGSVEEMLDGSVPLGEVFELAVNFHGNTVEFVAMLDQAVERARERKVQLGGAAAGVALLTYFKAKGLQWHTVIMTTCNEGIIPHSRAPVEDERRLFYVGMTRASSNLVLSYVRKAAGNDVTMSRFLRESGLVAG